MRNKNIKSVLSLLLLLAMIVSVMTGCELHSDNTDKQGSQNDTESVLGYNSEIKQYLSFDELLENATDLIEGSYIGVTKKNSIYCYEFEVKGILRGEKVDDTIVIQTAAIEANSNEADTPISTYETIYETGKSYLLLLSRYSSVYTSGDEFSFVEDSLIIPIVGSVTSKDNSCLYGKKLAENTLTSEASKALEQGTLQEYILQKIKDNPVRHENAFITSEDIVTIINGSDYVLKITALDVYMESLTGDRITYRCKIENAYKGEVEQAEVQITFPIETVGIGDTCIVAVNELEGTAKKFFVMSSKQSVFDLSEQSIIESIVNDTAN